MFFFIEGCWLPDEITSLLASALKIVHAKVTPSASETYKVLSSE